jgi:3-oxoacyl-[acyl-carrier-protein] synthase II
MMIANMASAMVAMRFCCKGPALPMVTACASGSNAIGEAMRLIRHGYADAMLAGGAEATVNALSAAGFSTMKALSFPKTRWRPRCPLTPAAAASSWRGRRRAGAGGAGARAGARRTDLRAALRLRLHLRRLPHDRPDPAGAGGARAIADAVAETGLDTDRIYYNAHGTGTPMNDRAETLAVKQALGEARARKIAISSTKSMTGHMLGAAGAAEAVASVLALTRASRRRPSASRARPGLRPRLHAADRTAGRFDLALSVSLGFGGHNACLAFRKAE